MDEEKLRERLDLLNRLDFELVEQDTDAQERIKRASPTSTAGDSQVNLFKGVCNEIGSLQLAGFITPKLTVNTSVEDYTTTFGPSAPR
jgi:hypothetical protein